jgi:hypothetical protein
MSHNLKVQSIFSGSIKNYMKYLSNLKTFLFVAMTLFLSAVAFGQNKPQPSPADSTAGTVAGSLIKITYYSPSVRGRKIWDALVPYNKVWRTGANGATQFETSKDIKINSKTLPAGKYSLFTIPGEKEWKIIFNSQTGIPGIKEDGSTTDDPSKDVLIVSATPVKSDGMNERFKIKVNSNGLILLWENLAVPVNIHK